MGVTVERVDEAVVVTLRWTESRNALGPKDAEDVADAVETAIASDASALILTGEGAFCSGGNLQDFADLSARLTPSEIRTTVYGHVQRIVRGLRDAPMPTIAAVDGAAIGLGMDLALACDMRFIGPDGWMRQGWARAGLIAAGGGTWFIEQVQRGLVWDLIANQQRLDGIAAEHLGLATDAPSGALEAALERTRALSSIPRDVLATYAKTARSERWPSDEYFDMCADAQSQFIGSERFRNLANAILADRKTA